MYRYLTHSLIVLYAVSIWFGHNIKIGGLSVQANEIVNMVLVVPLLCILGETGISRREVVIKNYKFEILSLLVIVVSLVISGFSTSEPSSVLRLSARYLGGIVVIIGCILSFRNFSPIYAAYSYLLGGYVNVCIVLLHTYGFVSTPGVIGTAGLAQGFVRHPNQFAILLPSVIVLTIFLSVKKCLIYAPILILTFSALMLTGSKANIIISLALTVVLVPYLISAQVAQTSGIYNYVALILLILFVVIGSYVAFGVMLHRRSRILVALQNALANPTVASVGEGRLNIWLESWRIFKGNYLTGVGAGTLKNYIGTSHAHNILLDIAAKAGILGVIPMVALISRSFYRALVNVVTKVQNVQHWWMFVCWSFVLLAYLASNMISDSFGAGTVGLLWISLAYTICGNIRRYERENVLLRRENETVLKAG